MSSGGIIARCDYKLDSVCRGIMAVYEDEGLGITHYTHGNADPTIVKVFPFSSLKEDSSMSFAYTAPAPGVDAELDKIVNEAITVLKSGGVEYDEKAIRNTLGQRLAESRGTKVEEEPEPEPELKTKNKVDVNAADKELTTSSVVAKIATTEAYWYEKPDDERFMRHFFELRTKTMAIGNLLVVGPSGAGKTEGLKRIAASIGRPFYKLDCATITTEDKWIGHKEIDHEGTKFILSEHLRWLEGEEYEPGILCYDEVNRVHPSRLNVLLPILDGSQAIFVPDAGRYIRVHPETIVVATANIGTAFGGTFVMDRALRERFNYTLEREFPPAIEEVKVLTTATGIDEDKAKVLVDIATQTRRKWETQDLESPISTRTLKAAALLVATGMSIVQALEYTALPLYKSDGGANSERALVKSILAGKMK